MIAIRNDAGKLVMESVIETKANVILDFIHGLRSELHVTFEEETWACGAQEFCPTVFSAM